MAINSWFRSFQIDLGIETLVKDLGKTIRIPISHKIRLSLAALFITRIFSKGLYNDLPRLLFESRKTATWTGPRQCLGILKQEVESPVAPWHTPQTC